MNWKKIIAGGVLGGILLFITSYAVGLITTAVAPYDVFSLGGMRAMNDPMMTLFFLYPFSLALAAAIVFDVVKISLKGDGVNKGIFFGAMLFLLITFPSFVVIYGSMTYPLGFHLDSFLQGIIGYPLMGVLFVKIWAKLK